VSYRPLTTRILISDLKIMKSLLSYPRMLVDDLAKESLLSSKTVTVTRRLEMMRESHIMEFTILTNISSTQLTGYIEFAALIDIDTYYYQRIVERIYEEMEEYLFYIPTSYQKEVIFAVFFCANISRVNSILRKLESYEGVKEVKNFIGLDVYIIKTG
jgi:hypothetical protein